MTQVDTKILKMYIEELEKYYFEVFGNIEEVFYIEKFMDYKLYSAMQEYQPEE